MAAETLIGSYNYALVALSVLIAIFASYAALDLAGRVTAASGWTRAVWLLGGAGAMGTGIWSMHYIGMLAFILPIPVAYHWPTVLLSLLAAILASVVALGVVSRQKMGAFQALAGSVLMGAGIAGMHYIGMAAMRLPATCQFNSFLVALSVVFAVLISFAALWITFHFRDEKTGIGWEKLAGALVMGAAIPVMHYTGMAAASFTPSGIPTDLSHAVSISALGASGVAAVTFLVLGLAVLTSWVDRRFAAQTLELQEEKLQQSEAYLSEAQRLSHTGSFGWRVSTGEMIWSEETFRIFQFDRRMKPTVELALERVHPQDLALVKQTIERASRDGKAFDHEYRLVMPDSSVKYVHVVAHALSNESGEIEFVGAVTDVTPARQAFDEIQKLKDQLYRENLALKEEIDQSSMFEEIVGSSEALRRVLVQVAKVAQSDSTVLILGETGTGKELIARAIHRRSNRSTGAFVRVNCPAIPPSLIASELFGHEKGAFTGALQRRMGRFESADGGTIFLDEVGELPAETQIALLRVLQEREFERVGGSQPMSVDVRVLAATNRDLAAAVNGGTFRQDLFYRLNVFPIVMPPLRERLDDIPLLVEYLIERYAKKEGKHITNIRKRTLDLFQAYDWPGNIRELQNVVERAIVLCEGDTFSVDETWLRYELPQEQRNPTVVERGLGRLDADREKEMIEAALAESKGRISGPGGAAEKLGIPRSTLESKIRTLGINSTYLSPKALEHGFPDDSPRSRLEAPELYQRVSKNDGIQQMPKFATHLELYQACIQWLTFGTSIASSQT